MAKSKITIRTSSKPTQTIDTGASETNKLIETSISNEANLFAKYSNEINDNIIKFREETKKRYEEKVKKEEEEKAEAEAKETKKDEENRKQVLNSELFGGEIKETLQETLKTTKESKENDKLQDLAEEKFRLEEKERNFNRHNVITESLKAINESVARSDTYKNARHAAITLGVNSMFGPVAGVAVQMMKAPINSLFTMLNKRGEERRKLQDEKDAFERKATFIKNEVNALLDKQEEKKSQTLLNMESLFGGSVEANKEQVNVLNEINKNVEELKTAPSRNKGKKNKSESKKPNETDSTTKKNEEDKKNEAEATAKKNEENKKNETNSNKKREETASEAVQKSNLFGFQQQTFFQKFGSMFKNFGSKISSVLSKLKPTKGKMVGTALLFEMIFNPTFRAKAIAYLGELTSFLSNLIIHQLIPGIIKAFFQNPLLTSGISLLVSSYFFGPIKTIKGLFKVLTFGLKGAGKLLSLLPWKSVGAKLTGLVSKVGAKALQITGKLAKKAGKAKLAKNLSKKAGKLAGKAKNVTKSVTKKVAKEATKAGGKALAKTGAKKLAKTAAKKIPFLGLGLSAMDAWSNFKEGNFLKAGLNLASGALSMVPGVGTAASLALDAATELIPNKDKDKKKNETDSVAKEKKAETPAVNTKEKTTETPTVNPSGDNLPKTETPPVVSKPLPPQNNMKLDTQKDNSKEKQNKLEEEKRKDIKDKNREDRLMAQLSSMTDLLKQLVDKPSVVTTNNIQAATLFS